MNLPAGTAGQPKEQRAPESSAASVPELLLRLTRGWRGWIFLALAALLPYLACLGAKFVFDDQGLIQENAAVLGRSPLKLWTLPYWPDNPRSGLYRPWTIFTFWIDAHLFRVDPSGFHAANLILHLATTLVLWQLLRRLFPSRQGLALMAAALFAVHPLRSEAVAWIAGRAELLAAFWGMLAYYLAVIYATPGDRHVPPWLSRTKLLVFSGVAFFLAVLSKESIVGLCLLALVHQLDREERPAWKHVFSVWVAPVVITFLIRIRVLGSLLAIEKISLADNVLAHIPAYQRPLNALGFQWIFLQRLLIPRHFSPDFSYPQLLPSAAWMAAGALLLILGAALLFYAIKRHDRAIFGGIAFVVCTGVLTSNVVIQIGTVLAERLTYLPSVGALWLMAEGADRLRRRLARQWPGPGAQRVFWAAVLSCGLALGVRTYVRALDWHNNISLFGAAVETSPRSCRVRTNQAHAFLEQRRLEAAEAEGRLALVLLPGYPPAAEVTVHILNAMKRQQAAVDLAEPLVRAGTDSPLLILALADTYVELKRYPDAEAAYSSAARSLPRDDPRPAIGLASALAAQARWKEAKNEWRIAVARSPGEHLEARNWAFSLWQADEPDSAETIYRAALSLAPEDPDCLNDLGWFLSKTGRNPKEGLALARRAFAGRPDDGTADTLLEALLRADGCAAARSWTDSLRSGVHAGLCDTLERKLSARCSKEGETRS